jgi:EAL domain-containing protein (putative c-di-GMP-specific phosphodiesterase class I)
LKADRSFISDIPNDSNDMAITSAIIAMAHSLRLKVVAEGVETTQQLEFLRLNNCDEVQGFLFSQPVPAMEMTKLLLKKSLVPTPKGKRKKQAQPVTRSKPKTKK